ncbi:MAG: alpha/beta fold hydrolase [Microcystaceae cyanobacterium]
MKLQTITCSHSNEIYEMAYWQWGDPKNDQVLLCVHGLTRNGRDFDDLATEFASDYQIICPDIVGRGKSDWLTHPENYNYPTYCQDILTLLTKLKITQVDWLGTSMGGIIGMFLAAQFPSIIKRLILNDVGAVIPKAALQSIAKYVLVGDRLLLDFTAVEQHIRRNYAGFGPLSDAQWQQLAQHSVVLLPDGNYRLNYDPNIAHPFRNIKMSDLQEVTLWEVWEQLTSPILLLHGSESELLLPETIDKMKEQQPQMDVIHFDKVGHAPALMDEIHIQSIKNWLKKYSISQ